MSFSKLTLISAAMFLGGAALVPADVNDIVVSDEGYTKDLGGRTDTLNGSFLSQNGSLADQRETEELSGQDAGTVLITGGGSLTYAGGAGAGYYKDVYTMSRGETDQEALEEAWESMDSFWSAGVFTGNVVVGENTTLVLKGQLSQYVSFQRPTDPGAKEISTPAFSGYAGISGITLEAGATVSFEGSTLNMFDSRPNLTSNDPTSGYNPTAVLALNMLNNLKAEATSRLIIGTDPASVNRIVLNTEIDDSTVGRLVGNGRLYVTGAGTISFIGESELDPGTRVDADGERDVSGNTWLAGNKLADILLGAAIVNVGYANDGAPVVDNVFDGATSVSFLLSNASNATVAGAANSGYSVNGAADYLGGISMRPNVNIYGHQVFNNFQSLWTERTMLSAEGSTIGSPVNQVYEPVRFSWRNPDGSATRSTGIGASVMVKDGAVLTINQSYGRDGIFYGKLNSEGSGLVVKTGEGQFLYQGDGTLGHLRIEEGNWIAAGDSLSGCKVEVSGTGSLNLLASNTGTFSGEVTALSRDATLLLSRSYTLINDLEEQPDTVLENADSLTENDYRTYGPGPDSQTAALQITNTQTLFYGTVSVTEGVTLILGETGGDAYASIFPNAGSIELLGSSGAAAGQRRYSTLNIYSGTQLVQNLSGTADASAVTVGSGAKLVLTQTNADITYAGGFSGSGDLVKLGANTQRVAGDLNGELFSGRLIVLAGGVAVDQGTSSGGTAALLMKSGTSASFSGPGQVSALIGETGSTVTISGDFRVSQSTADENFLKNPANLVYTNDADVYNGAFSKIYATTGTDRDGNDVFELMKTGGSNLFGTADSVSAWLRDTFTPDAVEDFLATPDGENLSSEMQESLRELAATISGSSTGVLTYLDGDGNLNASGWNSIVAAGGLELLKGKDAALENLPDESLYSFITHYAKIANPDYTYQFILTRSNASQISSTYGVSNNGWFSGTAPNYDRFAASFGFSGDDQAFAGTLTGAGSLIKDGSGTLKLTGSNAYTGATTVNAGTLEANRTSIQETSGLSIASGATFIVNAGTKDANPTEANPDQLWGTAYSELFSNDDARLSGTGTLIKRGDGNVSLGNALLDVPEGGQDFSGTIQVSDGALLATINPAARSELRFSVAFDAETAEFELDFARDGTIENSNFVFTGDAVAEVELKGSVGGVDGNGKGVFALDAGTTRNAAGELVGNNVLSVSAAKFSVNEAKVDSGTLKFVVEEGDSDSPLFKEATLGEGAELFFDLKDGSALTLDDASVSGSGTLVVATTSANEDGVYDRGDMTLGGNAALGVSALRLEGGAALTLEAGEAVSLSSLNTDAQTTLTLNRTLTLTGSGNIAGTFAGTGTLTFAGKNSAEGVAGDTLTIGNAVVAQGTKTAFGGSINFLGGTLEFAAGEGSAVDYAGISIAGSGKNVVKTGAGTVKLSREAGAANAISLTDWNVSVEAGELAVSADMLPAANLPASLAIASGATFRFCEAYAGSGWTLDNLAFSGTGTLAFDFEDDEDGAKLTLNSFDTEKFAGVVEITNPETTLTLGENVTEFAAFSGKGTLEVLADNLTVRVDSNADGWGKFEGTLKGDGDNLKDLTVVGEGSLMLVGGSAIPVTTIRIGDAENGGGAGVSSAWTGTLAVVGETSRVLIVSDERNAAFAGTTMVGGNVKNLSLSRDGEISLGDGAVAKSFNLKTEDGTEDFALDGSVNVTLSNVAGTDLTLKNLGSLSAEAFSLQANRGAIAFSGSGAVSAPDAGTQAASFADGDAAAEAPTSNPNAGVWTGNITGEGGIRVENGAHLTLTSAVQDYAGETTVKSGSTLVYGAAGTVSQSSKLTVEEGGTLQGGVSLAAENSAVAFASGSTFVFTGEAIRFTGTAEKTGDAAGTIAVKLDADALTERGKRLSLFEDVSGEGGNTITFEEDISISSDASLSYFKDAGNTENGLALYIVAPDLANAGVSLHEGISSAFVAKLNEITQTTDGVLNVAEDTAAYRLAETLIKTPNGSLAATLNNLSPLSYGAMLALPQSGFLSDVATISARIEQRRYDNYSSFIWETKNDWEYFVQGQGMFAEADEGATDTRTFDMNTYGVVAGADVKLDAFSVAGFAVACDYGKADIHAGGGDVEAYDFRATAFYGKLIAERFYLDTGAQMGFATYDVKRNTPLGTADGDATGLHAGAFANFGVLIPLMLSEDETVGLNLMPYVGLAYSYYNIGSFDESGADTALDTDSFDANSLRASIGASLALTFPCFEKAARLNLDVAYSRELLDAEADIDYAMPAVFGGEKFSAEAPAFTEDTFSIGPRFSIDLDRSSSVYAGYRFDFSTDSDTAHSVNIGFRSRF